MSTSDGNDYIISTNGPKNLLMILWEPAAGAEKYGFIPVVARISWICEGQHFNMFKH